MKKSCALSILVLLALASCATFGIQGASSSETREGVDFKLLVNAWDKKATDLGVVFWYRVNGGTWQQKPGIFNGSLYEAVVPGGELPAGYLEYYASMRNAKGQTVSTKPMTIKILSFAEAKAKAEREYLARLSDATPTEFPYNETATFRLGIAGGAVPSSVQCNVRTAVGTKILTAERDPSGLYAVATAAPHTVSYYSYQWTVVWQDPVFGQITSIFPSAPKAATVLDQAAFRARIEQDFRVALKAPSQVAGTYFYPPVVQARLEYGALAKKYSTGPRQVSLMLRRVGFGKQIVMNEVQPGVFSALIPSADLEQGPLEYSFQYSDSFTDIGSLQAQYPLGQGFAVAYKSLEDFRQEAVADARRKLVHQPPTEGIEGAALTLRLDVKDASLEILSATLDGVGQYSIGRGIPFIRNGASWFAAVPGAVVRAGASPYTITAIVRDPRFGDLRVSLPEKDAFVVLVKSLAELRKEREEALLKSLSHAVPPNVVQDKPLGLTLQQSPVSPNESASLFYRTAEAPRYRELRVPSFNGNNTFMLDAATMRTSYVQYYFTVSVADPTVGIVTATLRDLSSGGGNDFIVAPQKEGPAGSLPIAPLSIYKGPQADRPGILFFVGLANELGLYDIAVMVKVQNVDRDFRAFPLERRGKDYSFTLDSRALAVGNRLDFYYVVYSKGVEVQKLTESDGKPFSAVIR